MINRIMADQMRVQAQWFPVLSVTGPRQSGKSTLVKSVFDAYAYANLEDPQLRREALEDPVGFIRTRPSKLIIDEAQYAPELFSVIQVVSDERGEAGQYILSGSQNFLLTKRIGQSLAGRVGLLKLLSVSYEECRDYNPACSPESFMFTGGYPRLLSTGMPASMFFSSYLDTYVERDVAEYLDVRNLTAFRRFVRLCALSAGNLVNYSSLARDADIDARTARLGCPCLTRATLHLRCNRIIEMLASDLPRVPRSITMIRGFYATYWAFLALNSLCPVSISVRFARTLLCRRLKKDTSIAAFGQNCISIAMTEKSRLTSWILPMRMKKSSLR